MVFAKAKYSDGKTISVIYDSETELVYEAEIYGISILFLLPFTIHGNTYSERQESLRDLAIDFQYNNDGDTDIQLSMGELADACYFFERNGKRYGLLREFRENCIC